MTIRELCQREAAKMTEWHRNSLEVHEEFIAAPGVVEVTMDGAAWIWDTILLEFGKVRENLDVYQGLEHLSVTGKRLYGEGTESYEKWREETTLELLWDGYCDQWKLYWKTAK